MQVIFFIRKKENGRQKNKLWNGYHKEGIMLIKTEIENFLGQKTLAIVGVSRNRKKFSNKVYSMGADYYQNG